MSSDEGNSDSDSDGVASSPSSYTSGDFGAVARGGFTRMYVLSYSSMCPVDTSGDYRSEFVVGDSDDDGDANSGTARGTRPGRGEAKGSERRYNAIHDGFHDSSGSSRSLPLTYQLLYASGCHYFHGAIDLPDSLGLAAAAGASSSSPSGHDSADDAASLARRSHSVSLADLPVLLPLFQRQQDALLAVDKVADFRSEVRDVLYQLEEVGAFVAEELAKDKTIARIEQAAKELHWAVSPTNPTFFELQTHARANDDLCEAGVVLAVMKIVVRGVLLDVVYARNSYYVTLRDNSDELALEDTFIPNISRAGPCFVVRRYKDDDIKALVLWCAMPAGESSGAVAVEDAGASAVTPPLHPQLASVTGKASAKVRPLAARSERAVLAANDTQMYCLLPLPTPPGKKHVSTGKRATRTKQQQQKHRSQQKAHSSDDGNESVHDAAESGSEDEHRSLVVFHFNQYVYSGKLWLRASLLDDLATLSTHVFPRLRAQSHALEFYGETEDLPAASASEGTDQLARFADLRRRFAEIAPTLLLVVVESQSWIQAFLAEVDAITAAEDCTSSSPSSEWLASHLKAWLEADDSGEAAFFELELGANDPFAGADDAPVELLVWKCVVNAAVLVVVYRSGSFYMVLREPSSESDGLAARDTITDLFGSIPPLGSKGRGYLVRSFPHTPEQRSLQWLTDAKLLLWQTTASLAHEELCEARARHERRSSGTRSEPPCADWFVDEDAVNAPAEAKYEPSSVKSSETRSALFGDAKRDESPRADAKAALWASPSKAAPQSADKVGRRHHIPPLGSQVPPTKLSTTAPWDLRTGRPL
ncbi:hypothetical protein PybrP1_012220 [[Pythium] brassicae (nom. inval.)]|nr:hypothetical protein PybrP1_012220 [[Pythium] brassicae (nom. inval.)]